MNKRKSMACTNMSLAPCSTLTVQIKQGDEPATCILDQIIGEANVIDQRDLQGDTCRVINQHGLVSYQHLLPNCNTSSSLFIMLLHTHKAADHGPDGTPWPMDLDQHYREPRTYIVQWRTSIWSCIPRESPFVVVRGIYIPRVE